jgi:hypothetical protein
MAGTSTQGEAVYVCVDELTHPDGIDEAGKPFTGPKASVPWLLEHGHVTPGNAAARKQAEKLAKEAAADAVSDAQAAGDEAEV